MAVRRGKSTGAGTGAEVGKYLESVGCVGVVPLHANFVNLFIAAILETSGGQCANVSLGGHLTML